MKKLIVILLFFSSPLLYSSVYARQSEIHADFKEADSLFRYGRYQQALEIFDRLNKHYAQTGQKGKSLITQLSRAECYGRLGDLPQATSLSEAVESRLEQIPDDAMYHEVLAKLHQIQGFQAELKLDLSSAFSSYHQYMKVVDAHHLAAPNLGSVYFGLTNTHIRLGDYDSALFYVNQASQWIKKTVDSHELLWSDCLYAEAFIRRFTGPYQQAEQLLQRSLQIRRRILPESDSKIVRSYQTLGAFYLDQEQYHKAIEYSEKALLLLIGANAPEASYLPIFFNISESHKMLEDYPAAIEYMEKALRSLQAREVHDPAYYRYILLAFATNYKSLGDFDKALEYALKAKSTLITDALKNSVEMASALAYLGDVYLEAGKAAQSVGPFLSAAAIYERNGVRREPSITEVYSFLYQAYYELGKIDSSLHYAQKTLIANSRNFNAIDDYTKNPAPGSSHRPRTALAMITRKVELFNLLELPDALEKNELIFEAVDGLVTYHNQHFTAFGDQLYFNDLAHDSYSQAIYNTLKRYRVKPERSLFDRMLFYSEKNKSTILKRRLQHLGARKLLADSIFRTEQQVMDEISALESGIYELKSKGADNDDEALNDLQSALFDQRRLADSVKLALEQDHPGYYKLKYQTAVATLSGLQQALTNEEALLSYSMVPEQPIALLVTNSDFHAITLDTLKDIAQQISQLRSALTHPDRFSQQNRQSFAEASFTLYQLLMQPVEERLAGSPVTQLKIIPDQSLNFLPFETLIRSQPASGSMDYRSLDYLINAYQINYQYSATIFLQNQQYTQHSKPKNLFLGFAPTFQSVTQDLPEQYLRRGDITPLKWNVAEVDQITQLITKNERPELVTNSETSFKGKASNARIIHLATHAFVDEEDPLNSKIMLQDNGDTLQDGTLHAFEIFKMQLNADLVTLSACNTGYGKLIGGEGAMSLARAFTYSGAKSVVMSHWEVNDKFTAELMKNFYRNLSAGMRKDKALHKAKLQLIRENDVAIADPYYWAAFVQIGDPSPIPLPQGIAWYWWMSGLLLALVAGGYWWRKKG